MTAFTQQLALALPNLAVALATLLWGLLLRAREVDSAAGFWALVASLAVAMWQAAYALGYLAASPQAAQR